MGIGVFMAVLKAVPVSRHQFGGYPKSEYLYYHQCNHGRRGSGASHGWSSFLILNQDMVLKPIVPVAASWLFTEVAAPWEVHVWVQKSPLEGDPPVFVTIVQCLSVFLFSAAKSGRLQDDRQILSSKVAPRAVPYHSIKWGESESYLHPNVARKWQELLMGPCILG